MRGCKRIIKGLEMYYKAYKRILRYYNEIKKGI